MSDGRSSPWEAQFAQFVAHLVPDAAHDTSHIHRVVANARWLATAEKANLDIVLPAAWLHDCVTIPKNSPQRPYASRLAAETATHFLHTIHYPATLIPAIQHAIEAHSFSAQIPPQTLEAQVVQDADRLDALGAIGIARTLMLGGAMQRPLYDPSEPFPLHRQPDDLTSTIDHFYTKLLKLAETMQTENGRLLAHQRTQFMHQFLAQLQREIL